MIFIDDQPWRTDRPRGDDDAERYSRLYEMSTKAYVAVRDDLDAAKVRIDHLEGALYLIANIGPAAAGMAKPMPFKEWAQSVARAALDAAEKVREERS